MKSRLEIFKDALGGKPSDDDLLIYKKYYMSEEEKQIGKTIFEMNNEESQQFNVLTYNNSIGNLTDYDCPLCKNRGIFAQINKLGYLVYVNCQCIKARNNIQRLKKSGLGNLINRYTFENYKVENSWQKIVLDKAHEFIDSNDICFLMLGQNGSGKSHICTAISVELMNRGMNLRYMTWINDSIKLKQNKMNSEEYDRMIYELQNVDVLYIDDLFKTLNNDDKPSSADINLALEIINYRYNLSRTSDKRIITIISSEKTMNQLREYDEALAGRINEMADKYIITLIGEDKNYRFNNFGNRGK